MPLKPTPTSVPLLAPLSWSVSPAPVLVSASAAPDPPTIASTEVKLSVPSLVTVPLALPETTPLRLIDWAPLSAA